MSITYKVHTLLKHVPEYLENYEEANNGLAYTSEQGLESCSWKVNRIWDTFKTHMDNKHYPKNLKNLMITYLYRLPWNELGDTVCQNEYDLSDMGVEHINEEDITVDNEINTPEPIDIEDIRTLQLVSKLPVVEDSDSFSSDSLESLELSVIDLRMLRSKIFRFIREK